MTDATPRQWVVGFLFDSEPASDLPDCGGGHRVVLIEKNRPEWQKGRLNGVGGKVDPSDYAGPEEGPYGHLLNAMTREFHEETGVADTRWHLFARLTWEEGVVHFLRSFSTRHVNAVRTVTDETIVTLCAPCLKPAHGPDGPPGDIRFRFTPNLRWLIPLGLHRHDEYDVIDVVETGTTMRKPGRLEVLPGDAQTVGS